ncbi:MAG: hypothetical protein JSS91_07320 [Bacteroidetes bacterium]|nr:hypothetical protein [Bacteroidota bacterium]
MKRIVFTAILYLILTSNGIISQTDLPGMRTDDRIRISEALKISAEYGDLVWKNFNEAPFAILLVTNDNEFLLNHPLPSDDFKPAGSDSVTGSGIFVRGRIFNANMLATFPAVNAIPTIVVGIPENTGRSTFEWVITLLHEHFHQLQYSQPDYYNAVNSLDLSGGDETGMWMLNYKFPYEDPAVSKQFSSMMQMAEKTYLSADYDELKSGLKNYLSEKEKFKRMLNKKDYDYFSFQLWQEGIARYTEMKFAEALKDNYKPSEKFMEISDYVSPDSFYRDITGKLLKRAGTQTLSADGRNCFYTLGALEGLILDRTNPGWKEKYFSEKFFTDKYFNE